MPNVKGCNCSGADGLILEVHQDPEKSYVDGPQTITPDAFENLMKEAGAVARAVGRDI